MPNPEEIAAGLRPVRNATIKTVVPSPEQLAAREPGVPVRQTPGGVAFVRTPEERFENLAGYAAPFPSLLYRAGPRTLPSMASQLGAKNLAAWGGLSRYDKPFLHVAATRDPQFGSAEMQEAFVTVVPGARGQKHTTLDAGHFIQDNQGEALAEITNRFIADNPAP